MLNYLSRNEFGEHQIRTYVELITSCLEGKNVNNKNIPYIYCECGYLLWNLRKCVVLFMLHLIWSSPLMGISMGRGCCIFLKSSKYILLKAFSRSPFSESVLASMLLCVHYLFVHLISSSSSRSNSLLCTVQQGTMAAFPVLSPDNKKIKGKNGEVHS